MDTGPQTLEAIQGMDNFNRWMYERLAPSIGRRVLEVGAGIGNLTQFYLDRELVVATDVEEDHLAVLREKFGHLPHVPILKADFMDDLVPLLGGYRFDTAVSSNVLEHILDDRKALENMFRVLVPGGHVVILVPAFMWLFGSLDEHLLHHRRYTRRELVEKVRTAGFEPVHVSWMNIFGMPGWFLNARIRRVQTLPPAQLRLFDRMVPVFRAFEKVMGPPVGQSLIIVGRKP
jgi:SAM-dependent methyltransferase